MKRILAVLAVLALTAPAVAFARDDDQRGRDQGQSAQQGGGNNQNNNGGQPRGKRGGGPAPGAQTGGPPPTPPNNNAGRGRGPTTGRGPNITQGNNPSFNANKGNPPSNGVQANPRIGQNDNDRNRGRNTDNRNNDRGQFDNNRNRVDNNRGRVEADRARFTGRDRGYRRDTNAGRRFNFHGRAFVSIGAPRYIYPRGYSYRRWTVGAFLPSLFLTDDYYVDWDYIGLPPPGPDEEWVRYGPDAVLVDTYSGRIIDVAYGVFY